MKAKKSRKDFENLMKEYFQKYGWLEKAIAKEWAYVSQEADELLDS